MPRWTHSLTGRTPEERAEIEANFLIVRAEKERGHRASNPPRPDDREHGRRGIYRGPRELLPDEG